MSSGRLDDWHDLGHNPHKRCSLEVFPCLSLIAYVVKAIRNSGDIAHDLSAR